MKPKFRHLLRKALPALIVFSSAHAGVINPDTPGNILVPGNYNSGLAAADTIQASGGTTSPFNVTIQNGAIIVGDAGLQDGLRITSLNYTIDNFGSLSGNVQGIDATFLSTINNSGFINGVTGEGISSVGGGVINNLAGGIINGADDAIYLYSNGGTIVNNGVIQGLVGAGSDGISADDTVSITNTLTIRGVDNGVDVGDGLVLINNYSATITGDTSDGVTAVDAALITNYGSLISTAGGAGVNVDDGATVNNFTTFFLGSPLAGGAITGAVNGVTADDGLVLVNQNLSSITGLTGSGIFADDNATITNELGATITGATNGVRVSDGSIVTNAGTITGNVGIDAFGTTGTFILNNTGTITGNGGVAIDGILNGVDTLNLNSLSLVTGNINTRGGADIINVVVDAIGGSTVNGNINAGGGDDNINLTSGAFGSAIVNGNVVGGFGNDTITFTNGQTSPSSTTNAINGEVSFIETINKAGAGTAFVNSPGLLDVNTVTISSGGLYLNGNVDGNTVAQTTINANGAALGGTGVWDANIFVNTGGFSAGSIPINLTGTPLSAVGQVEITGDVDHAAGSFIRFDVAPNTLINNGVNSDLIVQTGVGNTYDVNGAVLRISTTNGDQAISNGTYTVVDSQEIITGSLSALAVQFNTNVADTGPFVATESGVSTNTILTTQNFITAQLSADLTDIQLVVQHDFAGLPGLSANQASLGAALDASVNNGAGPVNPLAGNPLVQNLIAALDNSNLLAVQNALASLTPDSTLNLTTAVVNNNYRLHRLTQEHLAGVRGSSEGSSSGYSQQVGAKGAITQAPASASGTRFTAWGALSYDWQDYEGRTSVGDYDGDTGSFTAGFDYRVGPALVLGLVLDGSKSDYDYTGGSSDIDSLRGAVYGTWGQATGIYSDFLLGYGSHDIDGNRSFAGIVNGVGGASTDASSFQALWTVGYTIQGNNLKHGPFAGLEYQSVDVDSFGVGGPFPIAVGDYDLDSLRGLIGYRINAEYGRFKPYATLAYAHEFEDDASSTLAFLPNNAAFALTGPELGSAVILTLGTGITINSSLSVDVGYRGEFSLEDEGLDSNGGSIGVNYSF